MIFSSLCIEATLASTYDLAGGNGAFSADADGFMVQE